MSAPISAKTQRGKILALLINARGDWVPLFELTACAAQYNARVSELRKLGFEIQNKTQTVEGGRHSWFRLVPSTKPEPEAVSESDFMRRHREEEAELNPLFVEVRP